MKRWYKIYGVLLVMASCGDALRPVVSASRDGEDLQVRVHAPVGSRVEVEGIEGSIPADGRLTVRVPGERVEPNGRGWVEAEVTIRTQDGQVATKSVRARWSEPVPSRPSGADDAWVVVRNTEEVAPGLFHGASVSGDFGTIDRLHGPTLSLESAVDAEIRIGEETIAMHRGRGQHTLNFPELLADQPTSVLSTDDDLNFRLPVVVNVPGADATNGAITVSVARHSWESALENLLAPLRTGTAVLLGEDGDSEPPSALVFPAHRSGQFFDDPVLVGPSATFSGIDYVAFGRYEPHELSSCRIGTVRASRYRYDMHLTLSHVRSGRDAATVVVRAPSPRCPREILLLNGSPAPITGHVELDSVLNAIQRKVAREP